MKKFIKALLLFIRLYRYGFYFSRNIHTNEDGSQWGFYRLNFKENYALYDIDFEDKKDWGFLKTHGRDFYLEKFPS